MSADKILGVAAAVIFALIHSVSAVIFDQDFSSSTNVADYIEATTPAANQFTVLNGGTYTIDTGRLKLVNEAGTGGNLRRWVNMEGTPVTAMSFSFDMELEFSEAADTRLYTGTIGEDGGGNQFMAWGIDATGTDNEWKVTGSSDAFSGEQTVTILLNDSTEDPINYIDPAGGTQLLATNSYDIWVGTTLVADGKTDGFTHPEKDLNCFNLGATAASACTYYFDNFAVTEIPYSSTLTVYKDDFSGAATSAASTSVPEMALTGFAPSSWRTGLDGNGRLEALDGLAAANMNYQFQIDTEPLTDNAEITDIKYTVEMRAPTNDWVMIGFQETNSAGMLVTDANVGPVVQFNPNGTVNLRGGTWGGGAVSEQFPGHFSGSDIITAEMTYHVTEQTMDLVINDQIVAFGFDLDHEFPVGTTSEPVVNILQVQLRNQQSAANGGAYVDSLQIDVTYAEAIVPGSPVIVYQDDFSGPAATSAFLSAPENYLPGFSPTSFNTALDGSGRLESVGINPNTGYRFQIDTNPLTDNAAVEEIKYTIEMRTPTNDWVMIGFQATDSVGMLNTDANVGPIIQFSPAGNVIIRGGTWSGGNISPTFHNVYTNAEVITAEMTYHAFDQTIDLVINDTTLTNGFNLGHEFPLGTNSEPVINICQVVLRSQETAANGGAYIDSLKIEQTFTAAGYAGWALSWGVDIGASTNDYDGDGLSNLYEYGLDGDPTDALDRGVSPVSAIANVDGTNWFGYVHPQRADGGAVYSLELTTDLAAGVWTNAGYAVPGTNVTGGTLDFVTNVIDMIDDQKFIRLIIE